VLNMLQMFLWGVIYRSVNTVPGFDKKPGDDMRSAGLWGVFK